MLRSAPQGVRRALVVLAILLALLLPLPGHESQAPRELVLSKADGSTHDSGVAVLLAHTDSTTSIAVRAGRWLWQGGCLAFWEPCDQWGDGSAGDADQRRARDDAWFAAQRLLGEPVGFRVTSHPPAGLRIGDCVTLLEGQPASSAGFVRALGDGRARHASVVRDSVTLSATLHPDGGAPPQFTSVPCAGRTNPYQASALTGVSGNSSALALSLAYVAAETGVDFTGGISIAATGAIAVSPSGLVTVERVGSLADKIEGAVQAGTDLVVVPTLEAGEARVLAAGRVTVLGASTLHMALRAICARSGSCPVIAGSNVWVRA